MVSNSGSMSKVDISSTSKVCFRGRCCSGGVGKVDGLDVAVGVEGGLG